MIFTTDANFLNFCDFLFTSFFLCSFSWKKLKLFICFLRENPLFRKIHEQYMKRATLTFVIYCERESEFSW